MNKITVLLLIGVCSIVYYAYHVFISDIPAEKIDNQVESQVKVIQPLDISKKSDSSEDSRENDLISTQSLIEDEQDRKTNKAIKRKEYRAKLIDLKNNKKLNYATLGEMIENIKSDNIASEDMSSDVDRIKHNLAIAKQMAELTKNLHTEIDGEKEFNHDVYEQLLEIQNGLIIPTATFNTKDSN